MSTLQAVELGVLGPLQVRQGGAPVVIPGGKPSAILTMLGLHSGSVVPADTLLELLWGDDPPRTAAKALQTHISSLRRALGDGFVLTEGVGWTLAESEVDAARYKTAARLGRDAASAADTSQAVARFEEALTLWRGTPELPDTRRGASEKTRWIEGHAALVEDRAEALLVTGRAAELIGELEAAVAEAPLRERRWGQLMLALYRAGRQGEALGAYQRARALLAEELGVDPGPDLRRLEAAIVGQDTALEIPAAQDLPSVTRTVTFLLTDIEGSTAAWEAQANAMAVALARHDELVEQVVTSRGGRLIKTRGEGDATFSVFERASAAAAAAIELQDAIFHEPWALQDPMRIRVALHTGEVELRDGDYFGRAVNRAARLRSLATGGQILCSGAIAELVIDSLPDDVVLADLGMRQLKNLARPEHVFELRLETAEPPQETDDAPLERPALPAVLTGPGPFVGRGRELKGLVSAWQIALAGGTHAVLIAGEPGVGKTRLAGEWSQQAYQQDAVVLYGRCDEDLGAPYQPFAEALRSVVPSLGAKRLRGLRGVEALLPLVPGLTDVLPDLATPTRADPETERYALFDAVVALLELASTTAPVVLVLDDLHWAAKPTLLLLRHLLRFGDHARVQIVGTYRSTDLDRSHPLAATLADLHRDGTANRLALSGLDEEDVNTYVAEAGYDDEELARALSLVTGGNPFFLIEALRHVDESGGVWDQSTLPQGVREAVSRRLSRLSVETNTALAAAAVVGSRFAVELVERVVEEDLVDAFDEACKAGIVIEEPGGRYRFNHAIVRQSLLTELPSVRRMRLHQRIAATLENEPAADDELLAELAHHYFECAWAGNAAKAVEYCRRAADQAVARLAYEGAADLYRQALHALEEIDDELPDRDEQAAELLVARCEALLAAGDVASATTAVSQLRHATVHSARLAAWATCFDGQLSMLIHPERLDEVETALSSAAQKLAELDDAAGEANAHTIRAACLARLGRIGDCEIALDDALTAARRARDHRRVNAVLAGAPLAALWGPNPVPRAGGRCLDVVRLLRITTDSPAVEATSTRCQALLEAFRGRAEAARRMIDSARRTVTELGLRHALLEVEQFAGIVELVADDTAAAESHLRQAYNGFRRMGLDADTAETAAFLGRTCLALDRPDEADELCLESERLAGHALKPSIAWRALRAQLLSRSNDHDEARRIAEAAVSLAERTDALVDHGDACFTLATVLSAAGDVAGARAAGERAVDLYERKGAAALADMTRRILGERELPSVPAPPEPPPVIELDNACIRAGKRLIDAINRGALDEYEQLHAPHVVSESHRKTVSFTHAAVAIVPPDKWAHEVRRVLGASGLRLSGHHIAVRGERLALAQVSVGTADASPGAPQDEFLQVYGIDEEGRICLLIWFDLEDMDSAIAELDAVHARFEEEAHHQASRLYNAASQTAERYMAHFAARDWEALAKVLADDISVDDRRRVVNAGIKHGRDAEIANLRAAADVGITYFTSVVIATRGQRLILARVSGGEGGGVGEFVNEVLGVVEINSDNQIATIVLFDLDDFDTAYAELDARYIAGEAADHARTWSVVAGAFVMHNRREVPAMTPDVVTIDHRRVAAFAPGEGIDYIRAGWELDQNVNMYIETVHRVDDLGAVFTWAGYATSHEGFAAEWRCVDLLTVDGEMVSRAEIFDEADLDAALAKFDQLSRPTRRLENTASEVTERHSAHFAARDWDALAKVLSDDFVTDDRRRAVNAGIRHGRDAEIANMQATAEVGIMYTAFVVIAARGERLILARASVGGGGSAELSWEGLSVVEINSDNQIAAIVIFDRDDFDSAMAELDTRYLAGEAAAHARTWSVIVDSYAAFNRHEVPATEDWVTIDHRRGTPFEPSDMTPSIRRIWDLTPDLSIHIESVHRLSNSGAVITHEGHGSSQEGFDAEWRAIDLLMVDGDLINRCEVFDETDLDAALARFDELSQPALRLENTATRVFERLYSYVAAGDWDTVAQISAENVCVDDRRRVVNAGILHGRDANIKGAKATVDVGFTTTMLDVLATRGGRLALTGVRVSGHDPEAIQNDSLEIIEVDAEERVAGVVVFDLDDFEAAIAELDARYIAGEAAAHAHTWSVVANACAAFNRHELPPTAPDWVNVDHRGVTPFAPGDMTPYIRATWDVAPGIKIYIETVHRLSNLGAVVTHRGRGTTNEGFEAEWREISLSTVEGGQFNRSELFDEADLDTALVRFDELSRSASRLENTTSQVCKRFREAFSSRDWNAVAEMMAEDYVIDDRRRVVNAGVRHGRDAGIDDLRASADLGVAYLTAVVVATRGERLALIRGDARNDERPEAFQFDVLQVIEIDAGERIAAVVTFDANDIDAAIAELDARYVAGEAAPYGHVWSVIASGYAALNRYEVPPSAPDYVNIDHHLRATFESHDLGENLRTAWDLTPVLKGYIEVVHQLSGLGAVVTHAAHGTTQDGLDAEWRGIHVLTLEGGMVSRCEMFDAADLDAALARFDELHPQSTCLENAASQAEQRFGACFAARDWDAMAELLSDDTSMDDRRRVVNAGVRHGRDAEIASEQATADVGVTGFTSTVIAIRGERLVLGSYAIEDGWLGTKVLGLTEINAENHIVARFTFDLDDVDAAFTELDARYLAGEAAEHARTWSVIAESYAAFNRHELPAEDLVAVDRRRATPFESSTMTETLRSIWDLTPDLDIRIEAVHRLSSFGAVVTHVQHGTSTEGFDAEWRSIELLTVDGDRVNYCEIFDEDNLDAALARFEELQPRPRWLENAAGRILKRYQTCVLGPDWAALAELLAEDMVLDDRRRVVNAGVRHGRDMHIADNRAALEVGAETLSLSVIATRGERLALAHARAFNRGSPCGEVGAEWCGIVEIDADERIVAMVTFNLDDIDAAYEELDARYLAGEAAAHADTWSVIASANAAFNRHEMFPTTPDWVNVDHRPVTGFAPGDMPAYIRATWDVAPDMRNRIIAVHRLTDLGAVITQTAHGTSHEGFEAEWQQIALLTVEGDLYGRIEIFDETDLDAAFARFEELHSPTRQLENTAARVYESFHAHFVSRDWDAITGILADDYNQDDRRRVVGSGVGHGLNALLDNLRVAMDLGITNATSHPIATRGEHLALTRARYSRSHAEPEAFYAEFLQVVEIDAEERITALAAFDIDDIDAAFQDLDARYLAGDAANHAHTWSVITAGYAALNRRELPETTPDWVDIDHRSVASVGSGDLIAYMRAYFDLQNLWTYVEAVHRLTDLGAVVTHAATGTSQEGFDADWRMIDIVTVDGELISGCEIFDEADLDAALARFAELRPQTPRLENTASRGDDRFFAHTRARDWAAAAEILAKASVVDDRRRVVNIGVWQGRDAVIANIRALADALADIATTAIATRGERLALTRISAPNRDLQQGDFGVEMLCIAELDTDDRIAAHVLFDPDNFDAAFEELDARYLAGEAIAYARTWSAATEGYAALNRHEIPAIMPDIASIDHRRGIAFAPGEITPFTRAAFDVFSDIRIHIEVVHRLDNFGAVFTHAAHATSHQGFKGEWREIALLTVDGDSVNRCEMFDAADLDAALARFDELDRPTPSLENAATRARVRTAHAINLRDVEGVLALNAVDARYDDRRKGLRDEGAVRPDVVRAIFEAPRAWRLEVAPLAIRGFSLALTRDRYRDTDDVDRPITAEHLMLTEVGTDGLLRNSVLFDSDDIDGAFAELDSRYLAGAAAAYAQTWSVIMQACRALNRHEIFATTADFVDIDHRSFAAIASGDLKAYMRVALNDGVFNVYIEAVQRLSDLGAVVTLVANGTSQEGFDGEWRMVDIFTVDGELISGCEIFDEVDLDAALARFQELQPRAPRLENAASRAHERLKACVAARDWIASTEILADDIVIDDRRRAVNSGIQYGRDAAIADMRGAIELGLTNISLSVIATRGVRLELCRMSVSGDDRADAFRIEFLSVVEINADGRIVARVAFDLDDIDASFEELDARYLAGEAAGYSNTWSVIARAQAAANRHEFPPTTKDSVYIDLRPVVRIEAVDLAAALRGMWDLAPDISFYIEVVHRLSECGAVVTQVLKGSSHEGFDAEWRTIDVFTVEGELLTRCEVFDEADLDAALARFEELSPSTPSFENAATRSWARAADAFNRRDVDGLLALANAESRYEDRRKGLRDIVEGPLRRKSLDVMFETVPSGWRMEVEPIAIRGSRLSLTRGCYRDLDDADQPIAVELLHVIELGDADLMHDIVSFDPDDINGAFAELTARWIALGEVAYPKIIESFDRINATINRHDWDSVATYFAGADYINHRQLAGAVNGTIDDWLSSMRTTASLVPDLWVELAEVLARSAIGIVGRMALKGTSTDGAAIEIPFVVLILLDGGHVTRLEAFDENQRDIALARLQELNRPV